MAANLGKNKPKQLTDWQIFTNNGHFNNPLPPNRRLNKRYPYFSLGIDTDSIRERCRTAQSRNQSALSTSTRRILSARSVNYRRTPRIKPIDLDLDEEAVEITIYSSPKPPTGRISTASSHRSQLWTPQSWSFSHLHRAIVSIDEQANKDYEVGRVMNALAAWQNALVFCDQISQRTQLWPENKAALDEEIEALRQKYRRHMEEIMKKNKNTQQKTTFSAPTRTCISCGTEQPPDQFHERFSSNCQHIERTICNKCISNRAKSAVETFDRTDINCPEAHCTAKLNLKHTRQLLNTSNNTESNENVNRQAKPHHIERKTEFIHCAHEDCGSGQFHVMNAAASPIVTCVLCKRQTCAVHGVKWHKGMTCNEYDQQQEALRWTLCPKCRTDIEKNPTSDRLTCSQCRTEFCQECMVDYRIIQQRGPSQHNTTCSHYQNRGKTQN